MTQFDKASGDTGTLKLLDRLLENENNDLWRASPLHLLDFEQFRPE